MTYTTIQQGEREMYRCDKCGIIGSCAKTIELEFCHRRHQERHREDIPATITKKKEMKYKIRGTGIKKFNKYFE